MHTSCLSAENANEIPAYTMPIRTSLSKPNVGTSHRTTTPFNLDVWIYILENLGAFCSKGVICSAVGEKLNNPTQTKHIICNLNYILSLLFNLLDMRQIISHFLCPFETYWKYNKAEILSFSFFCSLWYKMSSTPCLMTWTVALAEL